MKARLIRLAWAGAMIFGGCGILWAAAGWKVAAGTFLIMWGHYVEKHYTANARPHAEARSADSVQADVRCFDCQKPTDISNRYQYVIKTGRVVNSVFEKIIVSPLCKDCFDKRNAH